MQRVMFTGLINGEFCDKKCPLLTATVEGVPEHISRVYPSTRNYICRLFGKLGKPQESTTSFLLPKPLRDVNCVTSAIPVDSAGNTEKINVNENTDGA